MKRTDLVLLIWRVLLILTCASSLAAMMVIKGYCQDKGTVLTGPATSWNTLTNTIDCYKRYSGLCQSQPLSDADKKLDAAYEHIDKMFQVLADKRMAFLTVKEYGRMLNISTTLFWYDKADQVYDAEKELKEILDRVERREHPPAAAPLEVWK